MDWDKLADFQGSCQKFDEVQIKGKGMMTTYIATPFQDTSLPDPRASQSGSTPPGSSVGAMVVPRSSAELLEFFIQNYSKDEFCGVFQPLWATMSRVDAPFPSNVPRRYERSVPWREGGAGGLTREVETPLPSYHPGCDQVMPFQLNTNAVLSYTVLWPLRLE
jgi:hypothetical protein